MPKILLINPPFEQEEESVGRSKSVRKVLNIVPPLGITYVAAILERAGIEVKIIDCAVGISFDDLFKMILDEHPDVIGITSTTPAFINAGKIASFVREKRPEVKILIGGAHVSALPNETMKTGLFDIGVIGEGEITIEKLFRNFTNREFVGIDEIRGICYKNKNEICKNENQPTPASCRRVPYAVMITSRGCPTQCTFCDRKVFGERYRMRSVPNIFQEIEDLVSKYGIQEIRFFDDTFTVNKKRIYEVCDEFERRRLNITWTCLSKVANVNGPLLKRMKKAGCWQVLYGFESGDDRMLELLKKGNTVEKNIRAIRLTKEAGLEVRGDFIVGTPGETYESLEKTVQFAIDMKLDYAHFNKFVPLPGTELYRNLTAEGHVFDFSKSTILDHNQIYYTPEGLDNDTFSKFLDNANKRFYLRLSYILKRLFSIRTFCQLKGQISGFSAIKDL
jgi:radical SAM superfamily enzyme YgiQ (UPF0313 family)